MAEVISGMAGALQGTIGGMLNKGQSILDRFFPPEKRNELWAKLSKFATEKPMLAVGYSPPPPVVQLLGGNQTAPANTKVLKSLSSSRKSL